MSKLTRKKGAERDGKGAPSGLENGPFFGTFAGGHLEETRSDFKLFLKAVSRAVFERFLVDFWCFF